MELDPRVGDGVACVVVVGRNHIEEVGLDVVAGVTHIGVAHDDGRTLLGLRIGKNVVAELAKLAQYGLYVGVALGVATAAVGVHVGDIHVNDNAFGNGHLIVAEALLDAGVRAARKAAFRIVVLYIFLACRAGRTGPPEEIKSVGVSGGSQLLRRYASPPGAV